MSDFFKLMQDLNQKQYLFLINKRGKKKIHKLEKVLMSLNVKIFK
jgi:hypothetical protein